MMINLVFDLKETASLARRVEATHQEKFDYYYDPLGVIFPITVQFKLLFQKLARKRETGTNRWKALVS